MKTFFLSEGTEKKEISYITESELSYNALAVENMMLESDLAYQSILQEAILGEAQLLQENTRGEKLKAGAKNLATGAKNTLVKFFQGMLDWFKDIGKVLVQLVDTVISPAVNTINALVNQYKSVTGNTEVKVKSPYDLSKVKEADVKKFTNRLKATSRAATLDKTEQEIVDAFPKVEGSKEVKMQAKDARAMLVACKDLADQAKKTAAEIAKATKEGAKDSKKGVDESNKDNADRSLLERLKDAVTALRKKISGGNKQARQAITIASSLAKSHARALATVGARTAGNKAKGAAGAAKDRVASRRKARA